MIEIEAQGASAKTEVPHLRGWFLKEKRDKFKRRGAGHNRRWFAIEDIANPIDTEKSELALCYYKRSSENEDRCGWMFLNDVLSLSQDAASKWITIEHPSRVLRIQSPTPAQHRVWFSTLSKCCKSIFPESPSQLRSDGGPSLPHFMKASSSRKRINEPVISTPIDELRFLREITGQGDYQSDDQMGGHEDGYKGTKLFDDSNTDQLSISSTVKGNEAKGPAGYHGSPTSTPRSIAELDATGEINNRPTSKIHSSSKTPTESKETEEEKTEVEPLEYVGSGTDDGYDEVCSFNEDSVDSIDFSKDRAMEEPAKKQFLLDAASNLETAIQPRGLFDMNVMQLALEKSNRSGGSDDQVEDTIQTLSENGFHVSTSFFQKNDTQPHVGGSTKKSQSFSSAHTLYSRSSSYKLHFDDDHDIKPDENFVTDDWDE
eukprot:CCRYP_002428-RD/>CCRYP_002428-RD protein AED:0.18 eAED:0.18 QI:3520/1/1/1/0.33/0.23/13/3923/429